VASASLPSLRVIFADVPAANGSAHTQASAYRTPSLVTIDVGKMRTPCSWDRELKQWCEERGTELGTGNDGDGEFCACLLLPSLVKRVLIVLAQMCCQRRRCLLCSPNLQIGCRCHCRRTRASCRGGA
jgi:hypothetical protein